MASVLGSSPLAFFFFFCSCVIPFVLFHCFMRFFLFFFCWRLRMLLFNVLLIYS